MTISTALESAAPTLVSIPAMFHILTEDFWNERDPVIPVGTHSPIAFADLEVKSDTLPA